MKLCMFVGIVCAIVPAMTRAEITPQLSASIIKNVHGDYEIALTNVSEKAVRIPWINMQSPLTYGYWVFLYDPAKKKLQTARASIMPRQSVQTALVEMQPSQSIKRIYGPSEFNKYFVYFPRCYYLIVVYRKKLGGVTLFSSPSKPLYQCN